ncbi:site-specific integrase [Dysgonomonas macrotermitis]|uniref:Phage integrase family protein n=1 Tax=Dysgonomonas macrotermitis TaxID=1346286 RepID=A0A1M5GMT0_9BACT|nr:site-specific integrase [Dysgonomonas macrotermitis]SHG04968.1 Phage integrase family protein [Dysgonomonas macrotermitis]
MAELRFIIRDMEAKKPQSICIKYYFGKDTLLYATRLKVLPIHWDPEKYRVKNTKYCIEKDDLNENLQDIENAINKYIIQSVKDGFIVNKEKLKHFLDIHFGKKQENKAVKNLHEFFQQFIDQNETRFNENSGKIIGYRAKLEYKRTFSTLKKFESEKEINLDFEDITLDFYSDFVAYLQNLDLATNTIGRHIINLKAVLNSATEKGINKNLMFKQAKFKALTEESFSVALDESELEILHKHDFSNSSRLEKTRDLFLIGAWTGLRFSDLTRIKKEYIKNDILTLKQQKTGGVVAIPMLPIFKEIWDKYNGEIPLDISVQKFNENLKDVCKAAKINSVVEKIITKGGKRKIDQKEKWELIGSHTARRSFATNMYKSGFPTVSLMQITGHKTESAFLKYIKVTPEEHAKLLKKHWEKYSKPEKEEK